MYHLDQNRRPIDKRTVRLLSTSLERLNKMIDDNAQVYQYIGTPSISILPGGGYLATILVKRL
jgi:hypothetical protein